MKSRLNAILLAVLAMVIVVPGTAHASNCGNYYFKSFATAGSISPWCASESSWGVNAPGGTGFVAMVDGEDWGT